MTKIKFSKNFFDLVLQCNLEHVYDALLVNGYGTATTKKENIGKIFAVACRCPAARSWRNYLRYLQFSPCRFFSQPTRNGLERF